MSTQFPINLCFHQYHNHVSGLYFNFNDSILGETSSRSRIIPHQYFLATLHLSCRKVDGGVQKLTGNDNIGAAPIDDLTKAVHVFAHFSLLYSQEHILFCDLQELVR